MKTTYIATLFVLLPMILSGCLAQKVVKEPEQSITVEAALKSIAKGIESLAGEPDGKGGNKKTGLIVTDAKVEFNISANGTDELKVDVTDTLTRTIADAVNNTTRSDNDSANMSTKYIAVRGNKITLNLKHITLLEPKKTPKEMEALLNFFNKMGIQYNKDTTRSTPEL